MHGWPWPSSSFRPKSPSQTRATPGPSSLTQVIPRAHSRISRRLTRCKGGPGGSGVQFTLTEGRRLRTIVDSDAAAQSDSAQQRHFDIVSWDPRGINNTTPRHPGTAHVQQWQIEAEAIGEALDDPDVFARLWARSRLYGELISTDEAAEIAGDPHVGSFVTTASVVRDLVEIVERHGQWREREARRLLGRRATSAGSRAAMERTRWKRGKELLHYWGLSYGTIIGQTFATLQPHRVGRFVLDGVSNATDYAATAWLTDIADTDKITANFTASCAANPERCPLATLAKNGTSVEHAMQQVLDALRTDPVGSIVGGMARIVTHSDVAATMRQSWYNGLHGFRHVAAYLAELAQGNATRYLDQQPFMRCPRPQQMFFDQDAAAMAVVCTDGPGLANRTKEDFAEHVTRLRRQSDLFGNTWAMSIITCYGYNRRPKWRFAGPFGAETMTPILFASQTLDPVTPLRSAHGAAGLFPGSAVLEAQGIGHTSLSFPNLCAMKSIREYFRTGEVPDGGRKCAPVALPFGDPQEPVGLSEADRTLYQTTVDVSKHFVNLEG